MRYRMIRSAEGSACHHVPYAPGQLNVPSPPGPYSWRDCAGSVTTDRFRPNPRPRQHRHPEERERLLLGGQSVGAHQPHRLLRQHPDAVDGAAAEQHAGERQVVVGGRPQSRAACAERRAVSPAPVPSRRRAGCRLVELVHRGRAPAPLERHREAGVGHAERIRGCGWPAPRRAACPRSATARCRARRWRGCRSVARRADGPAAALANSASQRSWSWRNISLP